MKIKTGDIVRIIAGKDKGKQGKVLQVFPDLQKVIVEGLNISVRHLRSRQKGQAGQKIEFPAPLHVSNIQYLSSKTGMIGRIGAKMIENNGKQVKVRVLHRKGKKEDIA
ncbi:MAG: 50S ribosomal protein L24 [Candidatus Uhrbacteria bacterium GW2011_GWF2_41_16]|uniref:Large ribosomal subunit protein uL24 n=2 Tax=Candidatus Uhriibacteriota TaxID=1752732 RepID=A0A0G0VC59_9BACT|nr:MAG: 50S ribosomal protein L24 [Candidatus Uhrbacteria bacterium GW2011_GWA2_41_10]KKR87529.1 MAG: 50S ribosomal protein L24 [Candidatus Uhrbacteria bacterium GW2011_GWC2_41_11]KKR98509.1 MAG: 50S ribosomal protein L24 [Candidatus Uhrbacteria bacterium GW2011_GWF2_41_16]HBO99955.1 50S ribosomal protein L24 [Candidatus Uhrbacteria bacterium]